MKRIDSYRCNAVAIFVDEGQARPFYRLSLCPSTSYASPLFLTFALKQDLKRFLDEVATLMHGQRTATITTGAFSSGGGGLAVEVGYRAGIGYYFKAPGVCVEVEPGIIRAAELMLEELS